MERITSFVSRLATGLVSKNAATKQKAAAALAEFFKISAGTLPNTELQDGILYVRGSSTLKHALQLHKTEALEYIQKSTGKDRIKDIR